jgi:hypothetical protein
MSECNVCFKLDNGYFVTLTHFTKSMGIYNKISDSGTSTNAFVSVTKIYRDYIEYHIGIDYDSQRILWLESWLSGNYFQPLNGHSIERMIDWYNIETEALMILKNLIDL